MVQQQQFLAQRNFVLQLTNVVYYDRWNCKHWEPAYLLPWQPSL